MKPLEIKIDPKFEEVLANYPPFVRSNMNYLRELVEATAQETEGVMTLEETLKWGEPSFITKHGSTLRMDWKAKAPEQYALYFKCTSRLVASFKQVFEQKFQYEGHRALIFQLDEKIPKTELKQCIKAALMYHKVKHLEDLGMS
ncbi:DUF1801 domain-containing protein [Cellulophaga sp. Hel_I_12]|uniref:DUF1801 domain-containing protein n=1 Tax=Cellulophaga sp. Hel_I_12 TaxID=1249972 RepID=UPI000646C66E|nr:DUF1801 domain-containing protein [Cellulophaga sp. Hel_I_12]